MIQFSANGGASTRGRLSLCVSEWEQARGGAAATQHTTTSYHTMITSELECCRDGSWLWYAG